RSSRSTERRFPAVRPPTSCRRRYARLRTVRKAAVAIAGLASLALVLAFVAWPRFKRHATAIRRRMERASSTTRFIAGFCTARSRRSASCPAAAGAVRSSCSSTAGTAARFPARFSTGRAAQPGERRAVRGLGRPRTRCARDRRAERRRPQLLPRPSRRALGLLDPARGGPDAERRFHTNGRVAIGGISMGGFGALDLARHDPSRFCAVGGHSAAVWTTAGATARGAFDDAEDVARHGIGSAAAVRNPYAGLPVNWQRHMGAYLQFSARALATCGQG